MPAIIAASVVLTLIFTLLFMWGSILVKYDGELTVTVKALFLSFKVYPKKTKKIRLRDYSHKKYNKMLAKQLAEKSKKAKKSPAENGKPKDKSLLDGKDGITSVIEAVKKIISLFFSHLRIKITRLSVTVGGKDAASTAVTYGIVSQSVAYLLEILSNVAETKRKKDSEVSVNADFLSDKITADIELLFQVRVIHLLSVALHSVIEYVKLKNASDNNSAVSG